VGNVRMRCPLQMLAFDRQIENFLLDARGHIYLTDFGSAIKMGPDHRVWPASCWWSGATRLR
jgi:hypothetical protein